jgi:hypothetical protein
MPLSRDPDARSAQLANLKQNSPERSKTAGAHSPARLAPLRDQAAVELAARFPSASSEEVALLAHRRAQLELLAKWMDDRGLFANRQRGTVFPAVQLHERIATAFERQIAALTQREHVAGRTNPQAQIDAVLAELAEGEEGS